jgi:hypothetical protein
VPPSPTPTSAMSPGTRARWISLLQSSTAAQRTMSVEVAHGLSTRKARLSMGSDIPVTR